MEMCLFVDVFVYHLSDSMEVKPIMTRKLRRRPNDPVPIPDKRRKPAPDILYDLTLPYLIHIFTSLPVQPSSPRVAWNVLSGPCQPN